ncbi:MAG: ABC transporter permease [Syntrophobacteraceae bacterium]
MHIAVATPLFKSMRIQVRVIGALLMREVITRYGRRNFGFMWIFLEPMLFTMGVTLLWNLLHRTHGMRLPVTAIAMTGYSTVMLWRNAATHCSRAIEPNQALLYHHNVRVLDLFSARVILEIAGGTISMMVLFIFFMSIGWLDIPVDILRMAFSWLLLIWLTYGLGLFVGAMSERFEVFDRLWHPFTYLFFPVSGAAFMVDWLPDNWARIVLWFPTVHVTEMLRHGYFGDQVQTYECPGYLMVFNLILLLIGLLLARETGRRVEPQ